MIKKFTTGHKHLISDYIWQVYQDEERRTTPPYDSLMEVEEHLARRCKYQHSHHLGVYTKGELQGIVLIDQDDEDQSISIQGPYIHRDHSYMEVATEMMAYIHSNYRGLKCYGGTTRSNVGSQTLFKDKGFVCTEDSLQMSISKESLIQRQVKAHIEILSQESMAAYKVFHDQHYHDYYWSADRIYKVLDQWKVHILLENDAIIGSIFSRIQYNNSAEVYGCKILKPYMNLDLMADLVYTNTKCRLDQGINELLYFLEEGIESESAGLVGYKGYDTYMCFVKDSL